MNNWKRRPPCPWWCNRWTAGGLLLAVAAMVAAELMMHGRTGDV